MPGIAGFFANPTSRSAASRLTRPLVDALTINANWQSRQWQNEDEGVTLAAVGRDESAAARSVAAVDGDQLVMEGELFGEFVHGSGGVSPAEFLLRGYQQAGEAFFAGVEGRFAAAIWDAGRQTLLLIADKLGSKPLYYATHPDGFSFSTSVSSLIELPGASRDQNLRGLIQFFTFGHLWNNETFYSSAKCLGPAECLVVRADSKVATSCYWRPSRSATPPSETESLDQISAALKQAVDEQANPDTPGLGVALSGGLDARTVLGLVDTNKVRPACVSLGMEGSLDQLSARKLADMAGCEYHQLVLGEGFLEGFETHLRRMITLTDGHYLSQCIVLPTLPLYGELGVQTLLRGHVGELLHMHKAYNFSVDNEFQTIADDVGLERWLWSRLQSHLTADVSEPLLAGVSPDEFAAIGRDSLRESLAATEQFDHPLDRMSQLFLDQRTRRETAMSLSKFNSVVNVRVPYFDSRFLDAVFNAPAALRCSERGHADLLRRHRPEFLQPANSNTGAPVGSSPLWRQLCYYRMRVLAKLGVKGYQPYERLGLWLRRELRPVVEKILLAPECLDRGLFNADCVRGVVNRNNAGQANHTFLIMAMMIIELGTQTSAQQGRQAATATKPAPAAS